MTKRRKDSWDEYEKKMSNKRVVGTSKPKKNPSCLTVQRMSSEPTGRAKKYEPMETREFVDFTSYDEFSIDNVKEACEKHYDAPSGSCDILLGDRGPSCYMTEQILHKKVYFVRFINPQRQSKAGSSNNEIVFKKPFRVSSKCSTSSMPMSSVLPPAPSSIVSPKSISIAELLKARKLVKPPDDYDCSLVLEEFIIGEQVWLKKNPITFTISNNKFSEGCFREAFHAKTNDKTLSSKNWVIKKYKPESSETFTNILDSSDEMHARKQVQMHAVARNLQQKFSKKVGYDFGEKLTYEKVYFSTLKTVPVTIEKYVEGQCVKYVNNNGKVIQRDSEELKKIVKKAESFCHYTYEVSNQEMIVLDIQGSGHNLYDPEIATNLLQDAGDDEFNFCAGNLSITAITNFVSEHSCNEYCKEAGLKVLK